MPSRRLLLSLVVLPTKVKVDIADHLVAASEQAMDDLRSLRATFREMSRVCKNAAVGRCVALERFAIELQWNNRKGYNALLDCLARIRNPEAYFLSGMDILFGENYSSRSSIAKLEEAAQAGHNVAAYVAIVVLYRTNGGAGDNDTARWYIRQIEGEEESAATTTMMMWTNKWCLRCREAGSEVIRRVTWRRQATLPPPVARGNHQCAGGLCFLMSWEE